MIAYRYIRRVLAGDFSQGQAFWVILIPFLLIVKTTAALLSLSNAIQNPVISTRIWLPIIAIILLVVLPVLFFGCYRAIIIAKQKFKGGYHSVLLLLATTGLLYLTINTTIQHLSLLSTMTKIAFTQDDMNLTLNQQADTLYLNGQLEFGSSKHVKKWLETHPNTTEVNLNIDRGHLHEARSLAHIIIKNKLNTVVTNRCAASCMLVLVAGVERTALETATLQFHRTLDYDNGYRNDWIIERERIKDRQYYQRRAVAKSYLYPIYYLQKNDDYLEPGLDTLLNVGVITKILPTS